MSFQKFKTQDIAVDQSFDLLISGGDLVIELSDERHINAIVLSSPGNYRFAPLTGVDAYAFLNSVGQADVFKRKVQEQLVLDGYRVEDVNFDGGKLNIDAKRIR